jgi:hypothetical protein
VQGPLHPRYNIPGSPLFPPDRTMRAGRFPQSDLAQFGRNGICFLLVNRGRTTQPDPWSRWRPRGASGAIPYLGPFPAYEPTASWLDFWSGMCLVVLLAGWWRQVRKGEERLKGVIWVSQLWSPVIGVAILFVGWFSISRGHEITTRPPGPPCRAVPWCLQELTFEQMIANPQLRIDRADMCAELSRRGCFPGGGQLGASVWSCASVLVLLSFFVKKRHSAKPRDRPGLYT